MEIPNSIKKLIEKKAVALATINYDNGKPHNIAMEINKVDGDKIIMTDNHMDKSLKNIKNNPKVSIVFWNDEVGFRIDGTADYDSDNKWFEFVKDLKENRGYSPKGALIIKVNEIKALAG